jgi:4-hydroxy-tetrahydrodipicolinate reductase
VIDVLVVGACGRMGSLVARTVEGQSDLRLCALVDPAYAGRPQQASAAPAPAFSVLADALASAKPNVAVEFSLPSSVFENSLALLAAGVDTVVGATGLGDEQLARLFAAAREHQAHLLVAPNFALGAVLLMEFARRAAKVYERAEIVELHHETKIDAPSGTALRTAALMAGEDGGRLTAGPPNDAAGRGFAQGPVRIHSVRLPGLVAHQEVLFGGEGELLTLRHDSFALESFMTGVILAVRAVSRLAEPAVGLESILDL